MNKKIYAIALFLTSLAYGMIQAQEEATKEKENVWSGFVSLSMVFNDGNTNSKTQRVSTEIKKETSFGFASVYGEYNEGSSEGVTNTRNSKAGFKIAKDLDEKSYVFFNFESYKDSFKRLDRRNISTLGYGKKLINNETTKLNVEAGLTYNYENFEGASSEKYWGLRLSDDFTHDLESGVQIFQKAEYIPSVESSKKYTITSEQGFRSKLTESISLETSVKLFYDNTIPKDSFGNPIPRDNGHNVRRLDAVYYVSLNKTF